MAVITLDFNTEDENLNLSGTVSFRRNIPVERLFIKGLAEWRHAPANILHLSQDTITNLSVQDYAKNFSKVGINYIGIKARSNILISYATRAGKRVGLQKTQDLLTKFFKAIGAQSVKFDVVAPDIEEDNEFSDEDI